MRERTRYLKTFLTITLLVGLTTSWLFVDNEMLNELKSTYGQRAYDKGLNINLIAVGINSWQMPDQIKYSDVGSVRGYFAGKSGELS